MNHFSIPTCYFPSTALFVDDSRDFLLNFVLQLDEGLSFRVFDVPFEALDYIHQKRCELDMLSQRCLSEYTETKNCPLTNHTVNLDLAAIHAEIYNPRRFSEISVVVVDYAMPSMDGIEFCRRIGNKNIKKILLTGQADEKLAIEAFNEGLIHRYIQKSDPNVAELITKSISDLQLQYFQSMSEMIVRMLSVSSPSCLHDRKFAEFFWKLRQEKGIVEYYLADNSGSFLLLDEDANAHFLIVKNEADMRLHYDLALDNGASEEVLDQLASGEKIPCVWQAHSQSKDWGDWSSHLIPAKRLISAETYFYAYAKGPVLFDIHTNKILSYHHHLEELDAQELLLEA
ncbi:response regulator [Legionella jordanis]|uniref:Two component response regulator n=1 Tax=Legionella jordanis TaxID=456 RepID=A0A0W0VD68_9GAMM|nr:response regulator [Legionella jordanis]KTD17561.1 Two component response regulator [Legionella jordanis]RMX05103.1 response regulator [Legionella jordanis]RMX17359.1 response regulator [Legionella jordanis]VEH13530.1 Response regulator containing a CheY-like receiver domain and an HD-GYP domain [Legionella jordanis]HAT8714446.1 response regulator [Legionella jordanis]